MGARRSRTGRTAAVLPRGGRRSRSASTLLLTFALLVALGTATAQGLPPRADGHHSPIAPAGSASTADSAAVGTETLATDIAALSHTASPTTIGISHAPLQVPPLRRPKARPKRASVATTQDDASLTPTLIALTAASPGVGSDPTTSSLIDGGAATAFIAHASRSSRTRGQPGSDC